MQAPTSQAVPDPKDPKPPWWKRWWTWLRGFGERLGPFYYLAWFFSLIVAAAAIIFRRWILGPLITANSTLTWRAYALISIGIILSLILIARIFWRFGMKKGYEEGLSVGNQSGYKKGYQEGISLGQKVGNVEGEATERKKWESVAPMQRILQELSQKIMSGGS